jgi:hypothetical protein
VEKVKKPITSVDILPTGTCFEDVTHFFVQLVREDGRRRDRNDFCMVHGLCAKDDGTVYSHAWIEEGNMVHAPGILPGEFFKSGIAQKGFYEMPKRDFYKCYGVSMFHRYGFYRLMEMALKSGDRPPPWEFVYRMHCRDFRGFHGENKGRSTHGSLHKSQRRRQSAVSSARRQAAEEPW